MCLRKCHVTRLDVRVWRSTHEANKYDSSAYLAGKEKIDEQEEAKFVGIEEKCMRVNGPLTWHVINVHGRIITAHPVSV